MSETRNVLLWFVRATDKARLYTKVPPERNPAKSDEVWVPLSLAEHTSKRGAEHVVKLPEWFCERENL